MGFYHVYREHIHFLVWQHVLSVPHSAEVTVLRRPSLQSCVAAALRSVVMRPLARFSLLHFGLGESHFTRTISVGYC